TPEAVEGVPPADDPGPIRGPVQDETPDTQPSPPFAPRPTRRFVQVEIRRPATDLGVASARGHGTPQQPSGRARRDGLLGAPAGRARLAPPAAAGGAVPMFKSIQ